MKAVLTIGRDNRARVQEGCATELRNAFVDVSRLEDAASDQVTLDLRKPDFDLVEPRRVGRCVVDSDVRMLGQKRERHASSYEQKGCPR